MMTALQEMEIGKAIRVICYVHVAKFAAIGMWLMRHFLA